MILLNKEVFKKISTVFLFSIVIISFVGMYFLGFLQGYSSGRFETEEKFLPFFKNLANQENKSVVGPTLTPTPTSVKKTATLPKSVWGGPELWEAVNKRRIELGVNPLSQRDELCTIASIRLNELLELGKLDGHAGFSNLTQSRPDLKWIFDKYSTMAEFLAVGGQTPEETVSLWEGTLGHKKLLTGGEYVWGCIYAQNTFAVAITAF